MRLISCCGLGSGRLLSLTCIERHGVRRGVSMELRLQYLRTLALSALVATLVEAPGWLKLNAVLENVA